MSTYTPLRQRRQWSFLPYRKDRDEATGLVHDLPPVVVEDGIGIIASCGYGGPDHDNEAFARLMAAAPDLLKSIDPDTLEAIADEIDCFQHSARAGSLRALARVQRAAIAKATA